MSDEEIARIAGAYHAWRGEKDAGAYADVPGFCKAATLEEIAAHGFVLTPGRYVGAEDVEDDGEPFEEKMGRLAGKTGGAVRRVGPAGANHPREPLPDSAGPAAVKIIYRVHALQRMFQRGISPDEVRGVVETGDTVEDYPNDRPYPSRLLVGWSGTRPLHVVVAYNASDDEAIVITAYEPDPGRWAADFKRRLP